jgi:predicted nucleotidyltransferase
MNRDSLRRLLGEISATLRDVRLVYLFGSRIEDNVGPMSDYDVAVLFERAVDALELRARFAHELARALGTDRVDVVVLNAAPIELAYAIIAQGGVVFKRDETTRVEYEATVLSRYGDYLPVLRAQREDILQGDEYAHRVLRYRSALGRTERTLGQIAASDQHSSDRV